MDKHKKIMKRILVVSAHPDDLEIGCSGTLQKYAKEGATIISVVTVRPTVEVNKHRGAMTVKCELDDSYEQSGWQLRVHNTDTHPNGRPNLQCNNNTMTALAELIETTDIAILPNPEDYHQDHRNTYQLALPLVRHCKEIWCQHAYPYSNFYTTVPNLLVDISEQWRFKKKLLKCYPSYLKRDYINRIEQSNRSWGLQRDCKYAEAFSVIKRHA